MQPESEIELVRECKSGKTGAFAPLVHAYEGPGMRVALGMLGNTEDARDALQQAFVKAWKSLDRFDGARRFGPWFFQILRNQCRDILRSRAARFKMEALDERLELQPAGASQRRLRGVVEIADVLRDDLALESDLKVPSDAAVLDEPEPNRVSAVRYGEVEHEVRWLDSHVPADRVE